jgi:hypothetical protein
MTTKLHHKPCIPFIWIFLQRLADKGLIGTPNFRKNIKK